MNKLDEKQLLLLSFLAYGISQNHAPTVGEEVERILAYIDTSGVAPRKLLHTSLGDWCRTLEMILADDELS